MFLWSISLSEQLTRDHKALFLLARSYDALRRNSWVVSPVDITNWSVVGRETSPTGLHFNSFFESYKTGRRNS